MIAIVDYDMGNIGSIRNMLHRIGHEAVIATGPDMIRHADRLILPGVGAFDHAVQNLDRHGLVSALNEAVLERKVPVLGICLGMQLLTEGSEEGVLPGLGWIKARTRRFVFPEATQGLRLPHMGWNVVHPVGHAPLFDRQEGERRFYFVHSYHVVCEDPADVMAEAEYGLSFTAAVARGNIFGTQFHPEKSHRFGLALFRRFLEA